MPDFTYTYGAQNMTKKTVNGAATSYGYGADNQLCYSVSGTGTGSCTSPPGGATTFTYNGAGDLTDRSDGLHIDYNARGQTTSITPPGQSAFGMTYEGPDQAQRMTKGGLEYGYSTLGVAGQGNSQGVANTNYFLRDNESTLVAERTPAQGSGYDSHYYLFDGLGSVVGLTDAAGNLEGNKLYSYEPFGKQLDGPTVANPWRFASGYLDSETSFLKFGTRYYDPGIMRWTQQDPKRGDIKDPMSLNLYLYVDYDCVNATDPTGLSWWNPFSWSTCTWFAIGGAILGAISIAGFFVTAPVAVVLTIVGGVFGVIDVLGAYKAGCLTG